MLRLRKDLKIIPPSRPEELAQLIDPITSKTHILDRREIVLLRHLAKMPPSQVAQELKISPQLVKSFIARLQTENLWEKAIKQNGEPDKKIPALEINPNLEFQEDPDGAGLLAQDKDSGRIFTLSLEQAELLTELSENDLNAVAQKNQIDPKELLAFAQTLGEKGLLKNSPSAALLTAKKLPFWQQRWKITDPDQLLADLNQNYSWLWTGPAFLAHCLLLIFAVMLWPDHESAFLAYGQPLLVADTFWNAALIVLLASVIIALHEFAHGLTLKSYGGRVREMGLFLIYGLPSAYTDVSAAYFLKSKRQRAMVILAGVFFQIWFGAVSFLLWWGALPTSWLADWAYWLVIVSVLNLAFNLNPLIKLDGYYLLTLLTGQANLRDRAWAFFRSGLRGASGTADWCWLFFYGLASIGYTVLLVALIGFSVYQFAFLQAPFTVAAILFSLFVASQKPIFELEVLSSKPKSTETSPTPKPKPKSFSLAPLLWIFVLACLFLVRVPHSIGGEVEVKTLPGSRAEIRASVPGTIERVLVKHRSPVKAGQPLLEIVDWQLAESIARASGGSGSPRLGSLDSQIEESKIRAAQIAVEIAKSKLTFENDKNKAKALSELAKVGAFGKLQAQEAELKAQITQKDLEKLSEEAKFNRETLKEAQANRQIAQGELSFFQQKARSLTLFSPIDGLVLSEDLDLLQGKAALQEKPLLTIAELKQVSVQIKVHEEDIPTVRAGQQVKVKFKSFPDRDFAASVRDYSLENAELQQEDQSLLKDLARRRWNVNVSIQNPDSLLLPGMSGYAYIDAEEELSLIEFIWREVYRVLSLERMSVLLDSASKLKLEPKLENWLSAR